MASIETIITAFLATIIVASIISTKAKIPYTVVLVITGVGLAVFSISTIVGFNEIYGQLVGGGLFVGLILPPLLFESMMGVNAGELRAVAKPAFGLATIGVLLATVAGGLLLWLVAKLPFYTAFLFAALISPTDTATVLEIFKRVKVPSKLATMMNTEAGFNDATGITLFVLILASINSSSFPFFTGAVDFLWEFAGGIAVGLAISLAARAIHRLVEVDPISEAVLTLVAVYGSFSLADAIGVSGLVAVSTAGISYAIRAPRIHSVEHLQKVRYFWGILALIANSVAFLTVGLGTDFTQIFIFIIPIIIGYGIVMLARLVSVYSILGLAKIDGLKIPRSWKGVATLGGMRGAVSIVLAASLPITFADREGILSIALGVAFISITLQGFLLTRYARRRFPVHREAGTNSS